MGAVTQAIYDRMANDSTLTNMLAEYGGEPAIFSISPIPGDVTLPAVAIAGELSQIPFDTKDTQGRELNRDIFAYVDADGSIVTVESIAERIRTLFHRYILTVSGYTTIIADVSGPIEGPSDENVYCRIVSLKLIIEST